MKRGRSAVFRWLKRRTSAYVDITEYLVAVELAEAQAAAAVLLAAEALRACGLANDQAAAMQEAMTKLLEPSPGDECRKVRLRSEDEARAFGDSMEAASGLPMDVYRCRRCPRQPVTMERFWHIMNGTEEQRGLAAHKRRRRKAARRLPALYSHIDAAQARKLLERAKGEDA